MKVSDVKSGTSRTDKIKGVHKRFVKKTEESSVIPFVSDAVEVSDHASTLKMIRGLVQNSPDIRAEEVDRIVSQLKEGRYKINFEKVAESFIKEALLNEIEKKVRNR